MTKNQSVSQRDLTGWVVQQGLQGTSQEEILEGYCAMLVELDVPLIRLHVAQRAYHPQYGGIGFDWLRDTGVSNQQYGYTDQPNQQWLLSPLYMMLGNNLREYRENLGDPDHQSQFPLLQNLQAAGATDYLAMAILFEKEDQTMMVDPDNTPEGMLISWTSDAVAGFSDTHLALFRDTLPILGLALKASGNREIASNLLQVYLGRDAGKRVLSGEIRRGSVRTINAVICYFDLSGFTAMSERTTGDVMVAMLNDYFDLAVDIVRGHGGNVLKFMGDGMLAMFDHAELGNAATSALDAVVELRTRMAEKNLTRTTQGLPVMDHTLALHAGEILYGNIGGETRLDFTVIGSAVNLAARLGSMHAALGQKVLVSQVVQDAAAAQSHDLVPLGRYMLRGVSEPQMLYTLYLPEEP